MDEITTSLINNASQASNGTVQGSAAIYTAKAAMKAEAATAQLIQNLPQANLASSGSLGTKVNTYA